MTRREFFEKVIATVEDSEIKTFAENEIVKMNNANARRNSKPNAKQIENVAIKEKIVTFVTEHEGVVTATEIGTAVEISTQKASALARQLVESGALKAEEIKVKGKGKQKGYSIA